ncbi:hypothetical protein C3L33_16266, partial [Rhododendron williamsianum]
MFSCESRLNSVQEKKIEDAENSKSFSLIDLHVSIKPTTQLKKENSNIDLSIPPVRLGEKEQVDYEAVTTALRKAVRLNCAAQSKDGHWPAENAGPLFFTPPLNDDGGWGFYVGGHSTMIGSTLSYVALRLLGKGPYDGENREVERAQKWILDHGGAAVVPSWGKLYLSEDVYYPHTYIQDLLWDGLHYSLEMMCWWAEDPNGDEFKYHLARVPDFLWLAEEDGMKMQTFGSQLWDCSLLTQAIMASNLTDEYGDALQRAHFYIKESQIKENLPGDFKKMYRHITKGAWTFSDQDQGWAVSDYTAEALIKEKVDVERLYEAVDILLYFYSPESGGFAIWEPAVPQPYLEALNPSELFADIVVEREYALVLLLSLHLENTAAIIEALLSFKRLYPGYRGKEIDTSVEGAMRFVEKRQQPNGSWWVHFLLN